MHFNQIAFIGCGNMGGALAKAISKKTNNIVLSSKTSTTAKNLAKTLNCSYGNNIEAIRSSDLIFIGVKPQMLPGLIDEIKDEINQKDHVILVTMAAGIKIEKLNEMLENDLPIIRIMPNTPVAIGKGMIQYTTHNINDDEKATFIDLLEYAGELDEIDEHLIDAASAVSGCGPSFVYEFIEAMSDGGVACGLPRKKAQEYAIQTLIGAASLVRESHEHPGKLKDDVCSPAGSTIQGIRALEKNGFRSAVIEAVISAYEKNQDLGK